jgi:hypothetical protein
LIRRWTFVLGIVATLTVIILALYALIPAGHRAVDYYVVTNPETLLIGTITGAGESLRVDVVESPTEVSLTVKAFTDPFTWPWAPHADVGRAVELVVELEAPLGDRLVVDEFHTVPRQSGS